MREQLDVIRKGLQDLSDAAEPGRDYWVTFEANGNEHWFQCTPTQLNIDWPFSSSPSESQLLQACFGAEVPLQIDAWEAHTYVTLSPAIPDVETLIASIDRVFQNLYDLGPGYTITHRLEHG